MTKKLCTFFVGCFLFLATAGLIYAELFIEIQAIPTNEALDWESFEIEGDNYLAVANFYDGSTYGIDSRIYKWDGSSFVEFQAIPTYGAEKWESFEIAGETYLAVANHHSPISRIYKWNGSSFVEFQAIPTSGASDWESFEIAGGTYLAVTNSNSSISRIYKWDGSSFVEFQPIPTNAASDVNSFKITGEIYLAFASAFNGSTFNIDSRIYKWDGSSFVEFQAIPTSGASDWESFEMAGETYLAVANYRSDHTVVDIDSRIYKWDGSSFVEFQAIPTNGATDWESFEIAGETYLAVANHGRPFSIDSRIYKWDGTVAEFVEFQAIPTIGAFDWKSFEIAGDTYLAVANARDSSSFNVDSMIYKAIMPALQVDIDIRPGPGSYPNSIHLKSKGKVPVAILTTDDFDASNVDPDTVSFAGANPLRWSMKDVDADGDIDLLFHFKMQELDLTNESTEATLEGKTFDGLQIIGTDSVNMVPK